jgi:hypothetical protein
MYNAENRYKLVSIMNRVYDDFSLNETKYSKAK